MKPETIYLEKLFPHETKFEVLAYLSCHTFFVFLVGLQLKQRSVHAVVRFR